MKNIDDLLNKVNERMIAFQERFDQEYSEDKIKQIIDHLLDVKAKKIIEEKANKIFSDLDDTLYEKIKNLILEPEYIGSLVKRLLKDAERGWEDY